MKVIKISKSKNFIKEQKLRQFAVIRDNVVKRDDFYIYVRCTHGWHFAHSKDGLSGEDCCNTVLEIKLIDRKGYDEFIKDFQSNGIMKDVKV